MGNLRARIARLDVTAGDFVAGVGIELLAGDLLGNGFG